MLNPKLENLGCDDVLMQEERVVAYATRQLRNEKFYKFHNATSHSTSECRIIQQQIQKAIVTPQNF